MSEECHNATCGQQKDGVCICLITHVCAAHKPEPDEAAAERTMGKTLMKKSKRKIEEQTPNARYLSKWEIRSFNAMMEERRNAIGFDILEILEFEEIKQIEAVIFNGLVDSYILGRKNYFKRFKFVHIDEELLCRLRQRNPVAPVKS